MKVNKKRLMTLSFLQIAIYFLLIESISVLRSTSFDSVVIDISGDLFSRTLNILALIIGIPIIYFTPGFLWITKKKDCTLWELTIKSALLSVVFYTVAFSIPKLVFAIELSRSWMLLTCSGITVSWAILDKRNNPHYFTSVALLFFIPFLRTVNGMERKNAQYAKLSYAVVVGIILLSIFPFRYTLNQTARYLGSQTCIEATDYQAQVGLAEVVHRVFPFRRYGVGHHTLVYYAANG